MLNPDIRLVVLPSLSDVSFPCSLSPLSLEDFEAIRPSENSRGKVVMPSDSAEKPPVQQERWETQNPECER